MVAGAKEPGVVPLEAARWRNVGGITTGPVCRLSFGGWCLNGEIIFVEEARNRKNTLGTWQYSSLDD